MSASSNSDRETMGDHGPSDGMEHMPGEHMPVMSQEMVRAIAPRAGDIIIDGTAGRGGHTRLFLEAAECVVIAIDRDPEAIAACEGSLSGYRERVRLVEGRFGELDRHSRALGHSQVDAVALDFGVSSPQIDTAERGFSLRFDGPLDMRMEASGMSAADWVNAAPEAELAQVIRDFGEERRFRRVAHAIAQERARSPIETTGRLAGIVRGVVGRSADGIDPATRTFQAVRMKINDETGEIERGLAAAERILRPGGRLAILSFHSIEDRLVKRFLRHASAAPAVSRHAPVLADCAHAITFTLPRRRALRPGPVEERRNPRARSARLRSALRTATPAPSPSPSPSAQRGAVA